MEWPQALISTIFAVILLGMGILMMINIADPQIGTLERFSYDLEARYIVARIYNSPNCLAWEEEYTDRDSIKKMQVHAGTIDLRKGNDIDALRNIISECLSSPKIEINYELVRADGALLIESKEGFGTKRVGRFSYTRTPDELISDYYFVKVIQQDSSLADGILFTEVAFYK